MKKELAADEEVVSDKYAVVHSW